MMDKPVPIIDIAPFVGANEARKRALAEQVDTACYEVGFLIISGHGIAASLLDEAFTVSRAFFELPLSEKMRYEPAHKEANRGYTAVASRTLANTLDEATPPDLRERFSIGPLSDHGSGYRGQPGAEGMYQLNQWPARPERFQEVFTRLYREFEGLTARLMSIAAIALELPQDYFDDMIDRHFSACGSFNYPVPDSEPLPGQLRAGAHTDFGTLTILAIGAGQSGFQIKLPSGDWTGVVPAAGHLVVNVGDMMARWTNDRWRSTLHRVVNPPAEAGGGNSRQSIAYFGNPNYDAEVRCLDACAGTGNLPKYTPVLAGHHMYEKSLKHAADS
jgi:isopenicillin N synthase-like dioxygenase